MFRRDSLKERKDFFKKKLNEIRSIFSIISIEKNKIISIIHEQFVDICGCRCNERLKVNTDGSTRLGYTGLRGKLEHLRIETG